MMLKKLMDDKLKLGKRHRKNLNSDVKYRTLDEQEEADIVKKSLDQITVKSILLIVEARFARDELESQLKWYEQVFSPEFVKHLIIIVVNFPTSNNVRIDLGIPPKATIQRSLIGALKKSTLKGKEMADREQVSIVFKSSSALTASGFLIKEVISKLV